MRRDQHIAKVLCEHLPLNQLQISRLILELVEESGGCEIQDTDELMAHCRKVIRLGVEAAERQKRTVPFRQALEETLRAKAHRSPLTLRDIRYYMKKLMKEIPGLAERPLRDISTEECATMLEQVFPSPTQRKKARANLSGIFTVGERRGWCGTNPVKAVDLPHIKERTIYPLTMEECRRLLDTAKHPQHRACAPALGLMLWAGVRPHEVMRLRWEHIDWEEKEVVIPARHSKTGGGRIIPLCQPLMALLRDNRPKQHNAPISPKGWKLAWKKLRYAAGFRHWQPDILRHTFASYYVKFHHDLNSLQEFMGHRDTSLLRLRYVNLQGITRSQAGEFWTSPKKAF